MGPWADDSTANIFTALCCSEGGTQFAATLRLGYCETQIKFSALAGVGMVSLPVESPGERRRVSGTRAITPARSLHLVLIHPCLRTEPPTALSASGIAPAARCETPWIRSRRYALQDPCPGAVGAVPANRLLLFTGLCDRVVTARGGAGFFARILS